MFVFAYGSLSAHGMTPATIRGFIRTWDVAMDNLADIPGYKYYLDPAGNRPAVHVTFLNLVAHDDTDAVGFLLPVDPTRLAQLDRRERNYERVEVTERIVAEPAISTRVYTYLGRPEARARYAQAVTPVIARTYLEQVQSSFHAERARYEQTTRPPACPVRDLRRIDLPAPGPAAASAPRTAPPGRRPRRR